MSDAPLARRYDDDEVARILKRATEIRKEAPALPRGRGEEGLTLAELEEIAAEAGIEVAHLRQAALEVDTGVGDQGWQTRYLGGVTQLVYEVTVPGEFPESGIPRLVAAIRSVLNEQGQESYMAGTYTWRSEKRQGENRWSQVTVSILTGETLIRVEEDLRAGAGNYHGGITAGAGIGAGLGLGIPLGAATGSLALGIAAPVGILTIAYLSARAAFRGLVRNRRRVTARLLAQVEEVVRGEAGRTLEG